jgi:hypothetical protein
MHPPIPEAPQFLRLSQSSLLLSRWPFAEAWNFQWYSDAILVLQYRRELGPSVQWCTS